MLDDMQLYNVNRLVSISNAISCIYSQLHTYHKDENSAGLKFGGLCQIYLPFVKISLRFVILAEFELSSAKLIYWKIFQALVLTIFAVYSSQNIHKHENSLKLCTAIATMPK